MLEPFPAMRAGENGVISMELLSVIRRWRHRDHFSIREISRRTGLSRNTVRKYLLSDGVEPRFNVVDRPSKLDPYADKLSHMLRQKRGSLASKQRTIKQLHADLVALGYEGSYQSRGSVRQGLEDARQREAADRGRGAFVSIDLPCRAKLSSLNWSERLAVIGGERMKLQVAHFKLAYSRAFIVRAYLQQTHEMLFDAHNHAFRVLGGVPRRGIYDNTCAPAVDKVGRGKQRPGQCSLLCHGQPLPVSKPSSAIRPPDGRRDRSRRTFGTPVIGSGSPCRTSPLWRR